MKFFAGLIFGFFLGSIVVSTIIYLHYENELNISNEYWFNHVNMLSIGYGIDSVETIEQLRKEDPTKVVQQLEYKILYAQGLLSECEKCSKASDIGFERLENYKFLELEVGSEVQ